MEEFSGNLRILELLVALEVLIMVGEIKRMTTYQSEVLGWRLNLQQTEPHLKHQNRRPFFSLCRCSGGRSP